MINEYKKYFNGYEIPSSLIALIDFSKEIENESYAESFYLHADEDIFTYWLGKVCSEEEVQEYSRHIFKFANADGTGGFYAFWVKDDISNLEEAPVICYGSEGEVKIVAKNIKGLIKLLSYGPEGMDGNYAFSCSDDYDEFLEYHPNFFTFRSWIKDELGIEPIKEWQVTESKEVNTLIEEANAMYKDDFDAWQYQFYPSPQELEAQESVARAKREEELSQKRELIHAQISRHPSPELYLELAENVDNYGEKTKYVLEALKLDENHVNALFEIAKYDYTNKLKYYHKLETILQNPEDTKLYYHLAITYYSDEVYDKALDYYKKYLTLNPVPEETSTWGLKEVCQELDVNIADIYNEAIKVAPTKQNYYELTDIYIEQEDYHEAMKSLRGLFGIATVEEHDYNIWGRNFFEAEYYDYAIEVFYEGTQKIDDFNDKAYLHLELAGVYEAQDKQSKMKEQQDLAITYYKKELEIEKNVDVKVRIFEDIANIYDNQDDDESYIRCMEQALALSDRDKHKSQILYYIAQGYEGLGNTEQAIAYATKSYLLDEDDSVTEYIQRLKGNTKTGIWTKIKKFFNIS